MKRKGEYIVVKLGSAAGLIPLARGLLFENKRDDEKDNGVWPRLKVFTCVERNENASIRILVKSFAFIILYITR